MKQRRIFTSFEWLLFSITILEPGSSSRLQERNVKSRAMGSPTLFRNQAPLFGSSEPRKRVTHKSGLASFGCHLLPIKSISLMAHLGHLGVVDTASVESAILVGLNDGERRERVHIFHRKSHKSYPFPSN